MINLGISSLRHFQSFLKETNMIMENNVQLMLRKNNIIADQEVAIKVGDLYVAENVITKNRRILDNNNYSFITNIQSMNESKNKQILKG